MSRLLESIRAHSLPLILTGVFIALGLLRLNDISVYSPDSALYLIWGNSVAHGHGFVDDTKPEADPYLLNAPLYAVLLAPAEWVAPMSLTAAKIWTLMWGACGLFLLFKLLDKRLGRWAAIAGMIILGLNTMMILYSTEVLSEAPFLVFMLSVFLLVESFVESGGKPNVGLFVLVVMLVGTGVILREVGWALAFAAAAGLVFGRQVRPAAGVLAAAFAVFALWYVRNNVWVGVPPGGRAGNFSLIFRHFLTQPDEPILREFAARAAQNVRGYSSQISGALFYPMFSNAQLNLVVDPSAAFELSARVFHAGRWLFTVCASVIMVVGLIVDLWRGPGGVMRFVFVLLLFALIAIYPVYDLRFLLPFVPLMILYLLGGIRWIVGGVFRRGWNEVVLVVLAAILMIPNAAAAFDVLRTSVRYRLDPGSFASTDKSVPVVFTWPWSKMGDWVAANTPAEAMIATPLKDLARSVGGRKVLELEPNIPEPQFEAILRDYDVQYLLAAVRWGDLRTYEFLMQESKRYAFTWLHAEGTLNLYKVESRLQTGANPPDKFAAHADTVSACGLTRLGRYAIRDGKFPQAVSLLRRARDLEPAMEEPVFQTVVAAALMNDSAQANAAYRDLLALPQTLSQSLIASQLVNAMAFVAASGRTNERRSMQTLDASLTFWNNGCYEHARAVLDNVLVESNDFFAGMLWGFHYNMQLGDTAKAYLYLGRLQAIDAKNPVVASFTIVQKLLDTLKSAGSSGERARIHTAVAEQYRIVDLPEVALDEAQRALRDDPQYAPAMVLIARLLEHKSRLITAARWYERAARTSPSFAPAHVRAAMLDSLVRAGVRTIADSTSIPGTPN